MSQNNIWLWYDFWFSCQIWHFRIFQCWDIFYQTFTSKTASFKHVLEKVSRAKWPHRTNQEKFSCFGQNLDFTLYFTIKTSIFKLWPLFRFLCLINSFYRRYVSCVYNISNIYDIYSIYPNNPNLLPASIYFSNAGGVAHVQTTTKT